MHFKGERTLKNILVSPKDQDKITSKNSVIYSYSYRCRFLILLILMLYGVTKFAGTTFPSVLKKLTAVSESLTHQKFYFCYRED